MKLCDKCGAQNRDERTFCVDCGEKLDAPLSDSAVRLIEKQNNAVTEKLYNRGDPLHRTLYDKIVGIAALVGLVAFIPVGILLLIRGQGEAAYWAVPLLLVLAALESLVPALTWELEKMRLGWQMNGVDDATPGAGYRMGRILSETILTVLGLAMVVLMTLQLF